MNEAYVYGRGQQPERLEYRNLNERDLGMYIDMVSDELESFFLCAQPSPEIDNTFEKTEDKLSRSIDFSYQTEESKNNVEIVYGQFAKGIISEEYIVSIERSEVGMKGTFLSRYQFYLYRGNHWQSSVTHNNVENDICDIVPEENKSKYYSRDMTPYDFDEFFKDTAEINTQLRMRLVQ